MDFNSYEYLSTRKLGFIYNYIQTVVPFVYDNSLTLFDLLKKLVDYSNEIGKRNNDLANTFNDLVKYVNKSEEEQITFINNFVVKLRQEFEDWKTEYNQKYTEFTQEQINNYNAFVQRIETTLQEFETKINTMVANFQDQVNIQEANFESETNTKQSNYETTTNNQIQAWQIEIDNMFEQIREMVNTINNEYNTKFNDFETTINTTLEANNQQLFNLIQSNTQEIYREIEDAKAQINDKISTTNLQPLVDQEIEKYLNDGSVADALKNNYGSIIRITYWDTNTPPTIINNEPVYHYNPTTKVLTDCTTGNTIPLLKNSIYMYNGYVYTAEVGFGHITSLVATEHIIKGYSEDKTKIIYGNSNYIMFYLDMKTNNVVNFIDNIQAKCKDITDTRFSYLHNICCCLSNDATRLIVCNNSTLTLYSLPNLNIITQKQIGSCQGYYLYNDNIYAVDVWGIRIVASDLSTFTEKAITFSGDIISDLIYDNGIYIPVLVTSGATGIRLYNENNSFDFINIPNITSNLNNDNHYFSKELNMYYNSALNKIVINSNSYDLEKVYSHVAITSTNIICIMNNDLEIELYNLDMVLVKKGDVNSLDTNIIDVAQYQDKIFINGGTSNNIEVISSINALTEISYQRKEGE